jgi:hypothetical protein
MGFDKILAITTCDCLNGTSQNLTDTFIRRVRKSQELKNPDFRNHFERGKVPSDDSNCEEVCGMNGLSFDIWTKTSSKAILEKHKTSAGFAPKLNHYCIVRFTTSSGLIKHTPNQENGYNEYHYDFYKDDTFTVSTLKLIDTIEF